MKWIGQHIWGFISRFRNDVYLESLDTSTETNILVVDSDGKITKNADAGDDTAFTLTADSGSDQSIVDGNTLDIAGGNAITTVVSATDTVTVNHDDTSSQASVDNEGSTYIQDVALDTYGHVTGLTSVAIPTLNQNTTGTAATVTTAAQTAITSLGTLTALTVDTIGINGSTITGSGDLTIVATGNDITLDSDNLQFTSATSQKPNVTITDSADDANGSRFVFLKNRGAAGEDADLITAVQFQSFNDAGTPEQINYAQIVPKIHDASDGVESGQLILQVNAHGGGQVSGLILTGGSQDDEVDITVGLGTASVTTVAGTLTMGSTATINNSGVVQVAAQTVIDHDQLANFAANEHFTQANITTVGTIDTGVWRGTAITSAYLDADTAHLTTNQTFTGIKTFNEKIVGQTVTQKWVKNVNYTATQGTTETFIPMAGSAENTNVANGNIPILMPTAGKLLKVHLKTQRDHSGVTTSIKMYNWDADEAHGSSTDTLLGAQSATGPASDAVGIFDFRSSLDSGTNAFTAGEMLAISITNDGAVSSSCKYFVTLVFEMEWDY